MKPRRVRRPWLRLLLVLAALVLGPIGLIAVDGLTDENKPSDVAIVLGNTVNPDGQPSPWLRARLDRARDLYRAGLASNVIVSGALEPNGFDEATVMKAYLVSQGVPEARIVPDSLGINTMATGRNGSVIMRAHGWKSATVVSQYYHISRSRMALKAFGIRPVYGAHANFYFWYDAYSLPRELAGWVSYRWRLWRHPPPR